MSQEDLSTFTTNEKTRLLQQVHVGENEFEDFKATLAFALSKHKEQVAMRREFLIQ